MGIEEKAKEIAEIIEKQDEIIIVAHADADGIAGGAIAKKALRERGIKHEVKCINYVSKKYLEKYKEKFLWLIDVGNGSIDEIKKLGIDCVISDHHLSHETYENSLNPFHYGMNGELEISASGLTYLISSHLCESDANLAVIGAIGDLQDLRSCRLEGMNRKLLAQSTITIRKDLRIYGRNKPIYRMLAYSSDPFFPGLFKRCRNTIAFLKNLGIDPQKKWVELSKEEKKIILSNLIRMLIEKGFSYGYISRLFGEVYEMNEKDIREYATMLNAMARYGYGERAIDICIKGEYEKAENILNEYRKSMGKYINFAKEKIDEYGKIQYFHGGNYIMDTVLGTIAGMILKEEEICTPLVAFAENEDGIKVSARAPPFLIEKGINLSRAMKKTAQLLGGEGGGHKSAAGAIIPRGMEEHFLDVFNEEIRHQLGL